MLTVILGILGAYRFSFMLAQEDGPFDIFSKWRGYIGQRTWFGRGMHCTLCISFWVSLLCAVFMADGVTIVTYWFGIAGGVLVLHRRGI